ncbi:MAG: DUF1311 domain-containing protein [Pseudobutyrivibrio sp.]|uniref:lysozyme inhibitor LprI family protein n=1 Tax=Pseudobutyrivibrio sp. TaxID=2014367 RepID=UPI0025D84485|nr:lysozyme inhibitor LprI family protein [Pseudobutyrivibrio sp.]MBE5902833.1 DUF1311 domain-containing protein [Pseudobutyrivibrio sp.]
MSRKRRQKRTFSIILIIVALLLMIGVAAYIILSKKDSNTSSVSSDANNTQQSDSSSQQSDLDTNAGAGDNQSTEENDESAGITFEELSKHNYSLSSGAGGWSDDFNIEKDGFFHGHYHDMDMGDTGDDYPNGTMYICDYEGHLSNIQKIDEYTCKMEVSDLKVTSSETEYIEGGVRYIPSEPYAFCDTEEIEIYLPGKPTSEISEELQVWLGFVYLDEVPEKIEDIALVNASQELGMTSYDRKEAKEEAKDFYNNAKSSYDYFNESLQSAVTTVEMVDISSAQANAVDDILNEMWILVKYNTDQETFNKALDEQRQWLADRDKQLDELPNEGSLAPVDRNGLYAELTLERCEELLNYFD